MVAVEADASRLNIAVGNRAGDPGMALSEIVNRKLA
jgi:hypothetical protein